MWWHTRQHVEQYRQATSLTDFVWTISDVVLHIRVNYQYRTPQFKYLCYVFIPSTIYSWEHLKSILELTPTKSEQSAFFDRLGYIGLKYYGRQQLSHIQSMEVITGTSCLWGCFCAGLAWLSQSLVWQPYYLWGQIHFHDDIIIVCCLGHTGCYKTSTRKRLRNSEQDVLEHWWTWLNIQIMIIIPQLLRTNI